MTRTFARSLATAAAFLGLAAPASAVTGTQSVTADVANTLAATFPSAYAWGDLAAGATHTSTSQGVTVWSNAPWGVQVSSDLADGRMKEWDGSAYVASAKILTNALQWRLATLGGVAQGTSYAAVSSTPATATTVQPLTGDSGVALGVLLRQAVSYADERVSPRSYRLQLTYDAAQGY